MKAHIRHSVDVYVILAGPTYTFHSFAILAQDRCVVGPLLGDACVLKTIKFAHGNFSPLPSPRFSFPSTTMAVRKRPATAMQISDAVSLKRPAQATKSRHEEYSKRVRKPCQCGNAVQLANHATGIWYCKTCLDDINPEAAAEARELRMERAPKRPGYGAPAHQPCTSR